MVWMFLFCRHMSADVILEVLLFGAHLVAVVAVKKSRIIRLLVAETLRVESDLFKCVSVSCSSAVFNAQIHT